MKIAIIGAGKLGIRITEALLDGDYVVRVVVLVDFIFVLLGVVFVVFCVVGGA